MVTLITLTGTYETAEGEPSVGTVKFIPSIANTDNVNKKLLTQATAEVTLDDTGAFSVELPASDDADWASPGWTYGVHEDIDGIRRHYNIELLEINAPTVDLSTIAPVDPAVPSSTYSLVGHSHGDGSDHTHAEYVDDTHTHVEADITNLDDYSTIGHTHDTRYYTETETDSKLAGKSPTGHSHNESDIADLGSYPDATGQPITKVPQTDGSGGWTFIDTPSGGGGGTDDQTAAEVPFTPTGNVAASDVQNAIEELDIDKSATNHTHTEIDITDLDHLTIEDVQDNMNTFIVDGNNLTATYNDVSNTLTLDVDAHSHTEAEISDLSHLTIEEVQDDLSTFLVAGTNVTLTYDDVANSLTIDAATGSGGATIEEVQDNLGSTFIIAGSNLTKTYDDVANTLTIDLDSLDASVITTGTLADARISQSSVTQHQAAITITESQISDLGSYSTTTHDHDADYADTAHAHSGDYIPTTADITDIVEITQTAYDALGTPDATTMYVVVG